MGIRFRKSINLGKGFRINMSKSGPGFSWGGKGFRLTKKANGGFRGTAYIPGTGLSYQKDFKNPLGDLGKPSAKAKANPVKEEPVDLKNYGLDFDKLEATALKDVIKGPTYPYRTIGLGIFILGLVLTFVMPYLVIMAIIGAFLYFYKEDQGPVEIEYEFEDKAGEEYDLTNKLLAGILESDKFWLVEAMEDVDGANVIRDREDLSVTTNLPDGISTNAKTYSLVADNLTISFLPDALLLNKGGVLKALAYEDIKVDLRAEDFLEENLVADANLIQKTYLHANKNGEADKRYKDNPQMYLVEYGILQMTHKDMDLMIVFSDTIIDGK